MAQRLHTDVSNHSSITTCTTPDEAAGQGCAQPVLGAHSESPAPNSGSVQGMFETVTRQQSVNEAFSSECSALPNSIYQFLVFKEKTELFSFSSLQPLELPGFSLLTDFSGKTTDF